MSEPASTLRAEPVYQYSAKLTRVTDFGVSMRDVLEGKAPLPAAGLRVNIEFEGPVEGRISGYLKGCDYLSIRADGRMELDIKATLTTKTGARILLEAGGVAVPQDGSTRSRLRENVKMTTQDPAFSWVNGLEFWAEGDADVAEGRVNLRGFLAS